MVPRMVLYHGRVDRLLCPFCAGVHKKMPLGTGVYAIFLLALLLPLIFEFISFMRH
jgi:hypothetical protein